MNRTLHILSYVSKSMVGPLPGIGSDNTAHAILGGWITRSGQPFHAARSLTVAPRSWRQNRSSPTKNSRRLQGL
ncbi:hypothetical protein F7R13_13450 [Burkholderia territorii]|uniref:Uncharacterized protein n=1 Tax=Burkholderia territorii TaxID=1503055 RepID=A0A6L3NGU3_9BURK|nr:hypothetical protein F7R13_13450 [Burkholderia territorii]MBM2776483.1 hypothetical protein [Burkholderia territorii]TXG26385.1 hypothetical protein FU139_02215 [Burkholderia territorii]HDR8856790.1 hypothetical protein [Burkholderia territorii]HDR8862715.1 hypothetical protein [Burkholderia territorii]